MTAVPLQAALAALVVVVGCTDDPAPDPRLATPVTCAEALLEAYGIAELPQEEIDRRLRIRGIFHLHDPGALPVLLSGYRGPVDDALAGYVFGNLAYAKDALTVTFSGDTAHIFADRDGERGRPVVFHRDGPNWRIDLRESVPERARRRLEEERIAQEFSNSRE